ncbi:MAG TPA: glutathione S-transferase N-terminal domain-containing protein [Baekduia sp.]|uniref:glutathione S-transferase family protein n=1 Tax=Baekduia sp. TaxID=2600305 RepID=UPI002CB29585|nr:glutathione S-transferase N-terminal domain-containing protein [Baekduia sp.]HMJ36075.1 glutathione S-transferase N-terminal domain-containing protein [Baekduia sp.]
MSARAPLPILVTIPISHYCEKARWALDRAGVAYEERRHLPALHRVAVRRAGGKLTAPVLVCPEGVVVRESADIVVWADARAAAGARMIPADPEVAREARALADDYDERLGPATRLWVYHEMFDYPELVHGSMTAGVPAWQRHAFRVGNKAIAFAVAKVLTVNDENAVAAQQTFRAIFAAVDQRLADGREYLVGDAFSIADLTFAALAAPLIAPPEYGVRLPTVDELPPGMVDVVREHRETRAGRHALAMFATERTRPAAPAPVA